MQFLRRSPIILNKSGTGRRGFLRSSRIFQRGLSRLEEQVVNKKVVNKMDVKEAKEWVAPKKVEDLFAKTSGNKFASVNSASAGARTEKALDGGDAMYQLYSLATPNGQKIGIMLEELKADYDAHYIDIGKGDQFTSGFVAVNPNSKIPALVDQSDKENPINVFESGSILLYLADKHGKFIPKLEPTNPKSFAARTEVINWLMWQMGSAPYIGQFGHFFNYAPKDKIEALDYGVARYGMEVQRLYSVLDKQLSKHDFVCSCGYSIADMAIFPWIECVTVFYKGTDFLSLNNYKNVQRWVQVMKERPAVVKGMKVTSSAPAAK